jgi:hypothetical protein
MHTDWVYRHRNSHIGVDMEVFVVTGLQIKKDDGNKAKEQTL